MNYFFINNFLSIGELMKIYTTQVNHFNNYIICGDDVPRNSYRIVFKGSYKDCLLFKLNRGV